MSPSVSLPEEATTIHNWVAGLTRGEPPAAVDNIACRRQGWGQLQKGRSIADGNGRLCLNGQTYADGLGTHADSEIAVKLNAPGRTFLALAGIDDNPLTRTVPELRMVFSVEVGGCEVWVSQPLGVTDAGAVVEADLQGATEFVLKVREVSGNLRFAHVDWCEPKVLMADGRTVPLLGGTDFVAEPPLAFQCGDMEARTVLARCARRHEVVSKTAAVTVHRVLYADAATGLEFSLDLKEFHDFPAAEWVWHVRNGGRQDSPVLENLKGLSLSKSVFEPPVLHHAIGSPCRNDDFLPQTTVLGGPALHLSAGGGGRSSEAVLPFFNVAEPERGFVAAIGWSGEWAADFQVEGDRLKITGGMAHTRIKLLPGEEIRTPSGLLLAWSGLPLRGHNLLRQFILKHHTYRLDGATIPAPITFGSWGGMKTAGHLERIQAIRNHQLDYDYYWIDAGWYGPEDSYSPDEHKGDWAKHVGNWCVNPKAHPNGLKPISDAAHQAGMKFLLWFEPERAIQGTPLTVEHPEWFLAQGQKLPGANVLFNLGDPQAREWLTDFISGLITEHGVDCYRQDFNMSPLPYWQQADAPDRQGIAEIRHIEGLYAFWDALLRRHPGLIIDNCASGGRRLDLETAGRSIPLWRSDVQCFPNFSPTAGQVQTVGLGHWLPCSTTGTHTRPGDTYNFRSAMCTGVVLHMFPYEYNPVDPAYPWAWHRKMTADLRRAIPCYLGDLYPLTDITLKPEDWLVYQMHRADLGEGMVVAFRRENSPFISAEFALQGLDADTVYRVEDADSGESRTCTGQELATRGVPFSMPQLRDSRLLFYRKV
jgi:alpha-galactosidase